MNKAKILFNFSLVATVFTSMVIVWAMYHQYWMYLVYTTPFFAFFYPIAMFGTVVYITKKILKEKSIFELMSMAGKDSGLGGLMGGLDTGDGNKEKESTEE